MRWWFAAKETVELGLGRGGGGGVGGEETSEMMKNHAEEERGNE